MIIGHQEYLHSSSASCLWGMCYLKLKPARWEAIPKRQLFIDGEWKKPLLGKRISVINPATEEPIGYIPSATAEDVEVAVEAARRALTRNKSKDWSRAPGAVRAKYLRAIAAKYMKIKQFISTAKSEGATILCGGVRPQHLQKGFFVEPTIITDVKTSMQIWRDEIFGPVLCVKTFETEEEAIEFANDTHYGLAGAVISRDPARCNRISEAIQAGIVWINCSQPCFCQAPSGGNKRSGFGRELGEWGLDNYLSIKQVTKYISDEPGVGINLRPNFKLDTLLMH